MKNKSKLLLLILVLIMGVLVTSALAQEDEGTGATAVDTIDTVDDDPPQCKDITTTTSTTCRIYADQATFIAYGNPNTNYGTWADMYFGNQLTGNDPYQAMRPFLHFPVNQLQAGATITYATFNIYLISTDDTQSRQYNAYGLNSSWNENTLTWNNQPGRSATYAFEATLSNTVGWHSTNATGLTQNWYSNSSGNNGVEIVGQEGAIDMPTRRYSSNNSLNKPYLEVSYTTNSTPPAAWITTISPYVDTNGVNWTSSHFNIAWDSTDYSGTGIKYYDMYYTSNNGTNWTIGQAQVTHTSTQFGPLTNGTKYGFYVRARDNSGLEGPAPSNSSYVQKSATIDGAPPVVTIQPLPLHSDASGETLNWAGGTDYGSGILNYDVQWRVAGGNWVNLFDEPTTLTSYHVQGGTNGTTYEFRARGRDKVGNVPDWNTVPTASTTVWLDPVAYIVGFNSPDINAYGIYSKYPDGPKDTDEFTVLWAGDTGPNTSIDSFSLRYQKPGNPTWFTWETNTTATSAVFKMTASTTEFPDGAYVFQVKAKDSNGLEGDYHTETQGVIFVDRVEPWMDNIVYLPIVANN